MGKINGHCVGYNWKSRTNKSIHGYFKTRIIILYIHKIYFCFKFVLVNVGNFKEIYPMPDHYVHI